jgi:hypothetical protein
MIAINKYAMIFDPHSLEYTEESPEREFLLIDFVPYISELIECELNRIAYKGEMIIKKEKIKKEDPEWGKYADGEKWSWPFIILTPDELDNIKSNERMKVRLQDFGRKK